MDKFIMFGVQGGSIVLDTVSREPIAFIQNDKSAEFKKLMRSAGIETAGYQLGAAEKDAYARAAKSHVDEIIKAFKGET